MEANSLVIRGGNVVTETEILPNHDVVIKQGQLLILSQRLQMRALGKPMSLLIRVILGL